MEGKCCLKENKNIRKIITFLFSFENLVYNILLFFRRNKI